MIASSLHTVIIILVMPRSPATVFPSLTAVLNSVEESVCNSGSVCSFPTHLSYKIVFFSVRFKVGIKFKIRHEVRGCVVYDQCYVHTHTCGHTHAHLPHRAVTKPARLPPISAGTRCYWEHWACVSCVVGWPACCVSWGGSSH